MGRKSLTLVGGAEGLALLRRLVTVQRDSIGVNTVLLQVLVAVRRTPQPLGSDVHIPRIL